MIIILTATVTPNAAGPVSVAAAEERRGQYQRALAWWVRTAGELKGCRLVLVENSGEDLARLTAGLPEAGRERLVCVPCDPPEETVAARGKGAAEMAMLEAALPTLDGEGAELVLKCTGRLVVPNVLRLLDPPPVDSPRSLVVRATVDLSYADSRFFGATREAWTLDLAGMGAEVSDLDGVFLEHVLARRVAAAIGNGQCRVARFREPPLFVGVSGTSGKVYGGLAAKVKRVGLRPVEAALKGILAKKQY